jgi:hypothetical protein
MERKTKMTDDANTTMLLYHGLSTDQEQRLQRVDSEVWKALCEAGITDRCSWTTSSTESEHRVVRLVNLAKHEETIVELSASEFATISDQALLSRMKSALRDPRSRS